MPHNSRLILEKANWLYVYAGCFVCAMESGVQVYNVEPLAEKGRIGECDPFHVQENPQTCKLAAC